MRVALARGTMVEIDTIRRYRNAEHSDIGSVLRTYLDETRPGPLQGACIAIAGPVREVGRASDQP